MKRDSCNALRVAHIGKPVLPVLVPCENEAKSNDTNNLQLGRMIRPTENQNPAEKYRQFLEKLRKLPDVEISLPGGAVQKIQHEPLVGPAGFLIVAVAGPGWPENGDVIFNPDSSQEMRMDAIDTLSDFHTQDQRQARKIADEI